MSRAAATILIVLAISTSALAWGEKGHLMINRMAIDKAGAQLPEFMAAGRNQLIYDAYEPDRWREEMNTPMDIAQAADHFFDSELWGPIATLEPDRFKFMEKVAGKKVQLIKIGYVPYAILEMYGRLTNAFRQWRRANTPEDREAARVNALVYAGTLGHYVGDAANPMHLSIHYDAWEASVPNPNGYRTRRGLHSQFETAYVNEAVNLVDAVDQVKTPHRLAGVFEAVKAYLTETFNDIEPLYTLEKSGEFDPQHPKPKGTTFVSKHLARGATMLGDLWYTAWLESGEPVTPRRP